MKAKAFTLIELLVIIAIIGVPVHYGVRTKRYKLIYYYGSPSGWEFYDIEKDPLEMKNVYNEPEYADAVSQTKAELTRLKQYVGDTE